MGWMSLGQGMVKVPGLLLFGRLDLEMEFIPMLHKELSWSQRFNLLKTGLDLWRRQQRVTSLPAVIQLEISSRCNLRCPLCVTGTRQMKRPTGFMKPAVVRRVLDEMGETLLYAQLYGWGEPFLNPDLAEIIALCTARGVRTMTSTNGQCLQSLDQALEIVDAGLTTLTFAMDGFSQESYSSYRVGGSVEKIKRGVTLIQEARALRKSRFPFTNIRTVLTRRALPELEQIRAFARDCGVDMFSYKTLGVLTDRPDEREADHLGRNVGGQPDKAGKHGSRKACPYPFRQPTVFWDGTVVGCEFDYDPSMPLGTIGEQPFTAMWNGDNARRLRASLPRGGPGFCARCPYQGEERDSCIIHRERFGKVTCGP